MVLEATVVCLDTSEWMRCGDYAPTRLRAQADAANLLCGARAQANPENAVGVLAMGGSPRVLATPTSDLGRVAVAQLALKHRQNKNQRQRIVVFAGSPIVETPEALSKVGKKLRRNNVAVDTVAFGGAEQEGNLEKLRALHKAVDLNGNSHFLEVSPDAGALCDCLLGSPVFHGGDEPGGAAGGS